MMQREQIKQALDAVAKRRIKQIYFVACGGSKAIFEPIQYIFDLETATPVTVYTANEFVHRIPKALGAESLVITCSHSGNTPETVKATALAKEKGALTISFAFKMDSPLCEVADYSIAYTWGEEGKPSESNSAALLKLAFGILNVFQANEKYERAIKCVEALNRIIPENKKNTIANAQSYGKKYKREDIIYTLSSGGCYGVAYSFAECLLMEMLWVHSQPIHSGEFFHGPFEITDFDVPFILMVNSGETRPLDLRALDFVKKFSEKVEVVDTADFDMNGIDEDLRGYFAPIVLGAVMRQYADALADHKGHPLSVRRYMWRMEY